MKVRVNVLNVALVLEPTQDRMDAFHVQKELSQMALANAKPVQPERFPPQLEQPPV